MTVPTLVTRRLLLRPLSLDDAPVVQQEFPRWEIVRQLSDTVPWPYPADGALNFIKHVALPGMASGTLWVWSMRLRESGAFLGVISLQDTPDQNRGFWVVPEQQGNGYATEAADAVTDFWFETLGREVLRVPKAIDNPASRRISLRSGMRVVAESIKGYVSGPLPSELWEITRAEWRARKR